MLKKAKNIYLVRHGESMGNVDKALYTTTPDHAIELSPLGKTQAEAAGKDFAGILGGQSVAVYISPFTRTRQTWEGIRKGLEPSQIYFEREDPRIREQEWGNFQKPDEIERIDKERDKFGTFFYRLPDGESGADVYDRVTTFLDTLYRDFAKPDFPDNVLLVCHSLTIRVLVMRWLHSGVQEYENWRSPRNCAFVHLGLNANNKYELLTPFEPYAQS